ncbi:MAG: Hsp20/alpha crystallin family protein [Pyrobaculum sp.]
MLTWIAEWLCKGYEGTCRTIKMPIPLEVCCDVDNSTPKVDDLGDRVRVVARFPQDVKKDDIKIKVGKNRRSIEVRAKGGNRRLIYRVDLVHEVDPDTLKATYDNGVLTIEVEKLDFSYIRRFVLQ